MTLRLKHVAMISKARATASLANNEQRGVPLVNMNALRGTSCRDWVDDTVSDCHQGEILVCGDGSNAGDFFRSQHSGALASTIGLSRVADSFDKAFVFYLVKSQEEYLRQNIVGMGIPHVNPNELKNIEIPSFDLTTQRQIADFLNRETARIDLLVEKKLRMVEVLGKKREAVISNAVTSGTRSDTPMKHMPMSFPVSVIHTSQWTITERRSSPLCVNLVCCRMGNRSVSRQSSGARLSPPTNGFGAYRWN